MVKKIDPEQLKDILATEDEVQRGVMFYGDDVSITPNVYRINLSPVPTTYAKGGPVYFQAAKANTGSCTFEIDSLGAVTMKKNHDQNLEAGDIELGQMVCTIFDGSYFQVVSQLASVATGITGSSLTKIITQEDHGFTQGNVIRRNGHNFVKAQADSVSNAEIWGIVTSITDEDIFEMTVGGFVNVYSGLADNTVYYLDPSIPGALTETKPTFYGQVIKPVLWSISATGGYFFNMRGVMVGSGPPASGFNSLELNIVTEDPEPVVGKFLVYSKSDGIYCINPDGDIFKLDMTQQ